MLSVKLYTIKMSIKVPLGSVCLVSVKLSELMGVLFVWDFRI